MLDGYVHPDFAGTAGRLLGQLPRRAPGGAALCVYFEGRCVVDVWGGTRDREGNPWLRETTAPSFSTTKGVVSTLIHRLVDEGCARYDEPIAQHWPAFAAQGKESITIRQALCHEAGLYRMSEMVQHPSEMLDWQHMLDRVAAARPAHVPGRAHGYHAITYGWLAGGIAEAIGGTDLDTLLETRLREPLGLEGLYIGLPDAALHGRARLIHNDGVSDAVALPTGEFRLALERVLRLVGVDLAELRAGLMPFTEPFDWNAEATVQARIPAANGQFTARSLARLYAMLAEGGSLDGVRVLSSERVRAMGEVQNRSRDRVLSLPMHWRLGYHRVFSFGAHAPEAFGHFGYGGSGAFCDPTRRLSVALTLNSGVGTPVGDLRIIRIANDAIRAVDRLR
ncbi:MAG: serine hydrolase domain-containing protein [Pseudomonadota bacterium]|nr:serine hydrolase domain-containing protein [Pseudomonadota bacterium]